MPLPDRVDLDIYQGDTYTAEVTIGAAAEDELPPDISEWTPSAQLRTGPADRAEVAATFTTTITGAQTLTLRLEAEDTIALAGTYLWDLQLDNGGVITTVLAGKARVSREVTR